MKRKTRKELLRVKPPKLRPFWVSFCEDSAEGEFLGACLVMAHCPGDALATAYVFDIHPGGTVEILPAPPDVRISDRWFYRLLSRADAERFDEMEGK